MNSILASQPSAAPHLLQNTRLSPIHSVPSSFNHNMPGKKRKAEDEPTPQEDRMSSSPAQSPATSNKTLNQSHIPRTIKKARTNIHGRPLALPRLLETLSTNDLRNLLQSICERHPDLGAEVVSVAPRPSVSSAVGVLRQYESTLQNSFPYGGNSSDYAYNRVRQPLTNLLDALREYTPPFLPPHESQVTTSLNYLDEVTAIISRLPNWDSFQNNRHKHEAFEEISKAWALVIREGAKKGGGIQLQIGDWDQKLARYNELSGGKMEEAMSELRAGLGWIGSDSGGTSSATNDSPSIREQLVSGTYSIGYPVRVGPWRAS